MSMEIKGNYNYLKTGYEEGLRAGQSPDRIQKAKEAPGASDVKESEKLAAPNDEYISREKSGRKPSGLYRLGKDEDGNPRVVYEDPKKAGDAKEEGQPAVKAAAPKKPEEEKCVGDTNAVDQEIRKLKEEKQKLEQQIRSASEDEDKVRELEQKLAQVENELKMKDNDAYRRQNTSFSEK